MRPRTLRRAAGYQTETLETRRLLTTLIAEIDTGVDLSSQADSPYYNLASGYNAYTQQRATADGSNIADNSDAGGHGHGSTVADSIVSGIVAAKSQAGASAADVQIMPIRVTDNTGQLGAYTFDSILRGIFYAAYNHASVINISILIEEAGDTAVSLPNNPDPSYTNANPTYQDALDYARSKGALVVTGAGNDHINIDSTDKTVNTYLPYHLFPAYTSASNLIVAASTNASGGLTSVSNFGPTQVDLGTPAFQDATSFAAGYVSGITGVIAALTPGMSANDRVNLVESSAKPSPALAGLIKTGAVIDPAAAVRTALAPQVTAQATASPSTVSGISTTLSVVGTAGTGVTYTWSVVKGQGVTFSPSGRNGTASASTLSAGFSAPGDYLFRVTITSASGQSVTSDVPVTVVSTATSVAIQPSSDTVVDGGTLTFSATVLDQFGQALAKQPPLTWSVVGGVGGSVDPSGKFTAPASGEGLATVEASAGAASRSIQIHVTAPSVATPTGNTSDDSDDSDVPSNNVATPTTGDETSPTAAVVSVPNAGRRGRGHSAVGHPTIHSRIAARSVGHPASRTGASVPLAFHPSPSQRVVRLEELREQGLGRRLRHVPFYIRIRNEFGL